MLTNIRKILFIAVVLLLPTLLFADGKMFSKYDLEDVNASIPYQRAAIFYDNGTETMVLQSMYGIADTKSEQADKLTNLNELAWVVPVPSVPELASMEPDNADEMFWFLSYFTKAKVTIVLDEIIQYSLLIFFLSSTIVMLCVMFNKKNTNSWFYKHTTITTNIIAGSLLVIILSGILLPSLGRAKGSAGDEVEILRSEKVGIYNTKVIRSDSPDALISWLNDNGFEYSDSDRDAFSSYIDKDWCFVVAKVRTDIKRSNSSQIISYDGLPAPLIMRFDTTEPVYPMTLTGTGGFDTEVLAYLVTDQKMVCDNLELRCAMTLWSKERLRLSEYKTDPAGFAISVPEKELWVMKFKSTLKPEQMKEDVIFRPAAEQTNYREHIVKFR